MAIPTTNWNYPTTMWVGNGRIKDLPLACDKLGIKNPLFVTDEGLVNLDIVRNSLNVLEQSAIPFTLYSNVKGNPNDENVNSGVKVYHSGQHDGVIAFGGGSALDAAKAIALMVGQKGVIWDFEDIGDNWAQADVDAIAPIIAVPTTAGTGSEVGRASVITDEVSHSKKVIFHPKMLPSIVILDAELTTGLPANITAWTGVDAMVHAVEAYCAPGYHPMADGIALEAIRLIKEWLPEAVNNGHNLEARGHMLVAASMGATAFQKGLGSIHSVAHQLGAIYNLQHGLVNAILLPYGLKQNADVIEDRMKNLCKMLDLPGSGVEGFIDYVVQLRKDLNIPHDLAQLNINKEKSVLIGQMAFKDASTPTNAKPITAEDLQALFEAAVDGDLNAI